MTNDPRLTAAIEAVARTIHMLNKERHQFRWKNASGE
ncbi:hypothetical protein EV666_1318 [Camelimonas lactis]|uniref:Uncharacterized protein n=1 Tax=Camelimonas lactis TaxID=659006 RepID=A0A4R2GH98_9HYPH|nr:hypothetical protein EV666_1318 [Camelimonas lactis]